MQAMPDIRIRKAREIFPASFICWSSFLLNLGVRAVYFSIMPCPSKDGVLWRRSALEKLDAIIIKESTNVNTFLVNRCTGGRTGKVSGVGACRRIRAGRLACIPAPATGALLLRPKICPNNGRCMRCFRPFRRISRATRRMPEAPGGNHQVRAFRTRCGVIGN